MLKNIKITKLITLLALSILVISFTACKPTTYVVTDDALDTNKTLSYQDKY